MRLFVCLCACQSVREYISGTPGPINTKFCVQISLGRGSIFLRWRCATLCTSGFMDDVTFGLNGATPKDGDCTVQRLKWTGWRYGGGVWCLWMLVTFCLCIMTVQAVKMKLLVLSMILSSCLVHVYCDCTAEQAATVQQQFDDTFCCQTRVREFLAAGIERSAPLQNKLELSN